MLLSAPLAPCPFDSTAIPFQYFVEACPDLEPKPTRRVSTASTESELREHYFATAQCVFDHFRAKPYWQTDLLSNMDLCEKTLGKPWRMLGQQDALALAGLDSELQQAVPSDPRGWYFATFFTYARTPEGELGTVHIGTSQSVTRFHTEQHRGRHEDNRLSLRCVRPDAPQPAAPRTIPDDARSCGELLRSYMSKKPEPPSVDANSFQKPPAPAIVQFQSYAATLASSARPIDIKRAKRELSRVGALAQELKARLPTTYAIRKQVLIQLSRMNPDSLTPEQSRELPRVLDALRSAGTDAPPESHLAQREWQSLHAALATLSGHIAQEYRGLGHTLRLCQQLELVGAGRVSKVAPEKIQKWRKEVKQSPVTCSKIAPRQAELSEVSESIRRLMDTSLQALAPSVAAGLRAP